MSFVLVLVNVLRGLLLVVVGWMVNDRNVVQLGRNCTAYLAD